MLVEMYEIVKGLGRGERREERGEGWKVKKKNECVMFFGDDRFEY